ncbi:type II toxin-antitoxin system RelE/ParE family toxin [Azospirillum isscasi]|uniref:type II toxin-antitoxin system RelE/ParE family toxin n=1 Tax=Azospirillum isscasi TaxID=3053926 RepID=UPI00389903FE
MNQIRWAQPARNDFLSICEWIEQRNPGAAGTVGRRVLDAVDRIGGTPRIGRTGRVPRNWNWWFPACLTSSSI